MGRGRTTKEIKNQKSREHNLLEKNVSRTARGYFERPAYDISCERQCTLCKKLER